MPALEDLLEFTLPAELEAHEPPEVRGYGREDVRLLVSCYSVMLELSSK